MAVLTIKGKTTNDSVAIKNPTGDTTYFTAGETSAILGASVTGGSGLDALPAAGVSGTLGSSVVIPAAGITGTLGSGVTIPAAGITGTLGSGVFPAGAITNFESYVNSTLETLGLSAGSNAAATFFTVSYDKKQTGSKLLVQSRITGSGDMSGACGLGFKYGASADIWCGSYTYAHDSNTNLAYHLMIQGELAGHTDIGVQTLTLQYGGGAAARPARTINPTQTENSDWPLATQYSSVYVWEVL